MKNTLTPGRSSQHSVRRAEVHSVKLPSDYQWKVLGWLCEDLQAMHDDPKWIEMCDIVRGIVRNRDTEGYLALSMKWGLQSIAPTFDTTPALSRWRYQLASLLKKFPFESDKDVRVANATEKFRLYERNCLIFNQVFSRNLYMIERDTLGESLVTYAPKFFEYVLGSELPEISQLTLWSRHGPGASIGMIDGETCTYHKYARWPYTCTTAALGLARFCIDQDERWIGALQDSYRERFNIGKNLPLNLDVFWSRVLTASDTSRITFVPKDARTERTIAIEPTMNLWFQLGVDGYIRRRLKRWGVNLDDQTKNQQLARLGSLRENQESDPFVTIDLEGASDSVSTELVRLLAPAKWYTYLMNIRTPKGVLDGEEFVFNKISSMGNGYTFALESLLFTAVIYAVYRHDGEHLDPGEFAVYGDDIIVRRSKYLKVVEALRLFGFTVNLQKTFVFDEVRESCGADWFNGTLIRPVFLTSFPGTVMELWGDINRLQRMLCLRLWRIGLYHDSILLRNMDKWIPERFRLHQGPCSDTEFDTYRHTPDPQGQRRRYLWYWRKLVTKPIPLSGDNFLFRKLMHPLRPSPGSSPGSGGSIFTVTHRNMLKVSHTYSCADYWQSEYTEQLNPWHGSR